MPQKFYFAWLAASLSDKVEQNADEDEQNTDEMEQDTDEVEKNTDEMEQDTDEVEQNTDEVEQNTDEMEQDTDEVEQLFDKVEQNTDAVDQNTCGTLVMTDNDTDIGDPAHIDDHADDIPTVSENNNNSMDARVVIMDNLDAYHGVTQKPEC